MSWDYEQKRFNDEDERNQKINENIEENKKKSFIETVSEIIGTVIHAASIVAKVASCIVGAGNFFKEIFDLFK